MDSNLGVVITLKGRKISLRSCKVIKKKGTRKILLSATTNYVHFSRNDNKIEKEYHFLVELVTGAVCISSRGTLNM